MLWIIALVAVVSLVLGWFFSKVEAIPHQKDKS